MNVQAMTQAEFADKVFSDTTENLILIEWQLRHIRKDKPFSDTFTYGLAHEIVNGELQGRQEKAAKKARSLNQRIFDFCTELYAKDTFYWRSRDFRILVSPGTVSVHAITDTLTIEPMILHLVIDGQNRVHCLFADISDNDKQYAYLQLVKMV